MKFINKKKACFLSLLLAPMFLMCIGCASTTYKKELTKKTEEINIMKVDVQHKAKAINDLLDRLSWKDQEIGRLTDELRNSKTIIASLSKDIERLRETDLLEHLSVKDQEIGKLSDDLHTATTTIESLKNNIEKLQKIDLLERLSVKDQEIGKLTDELHTTQSTITNLKTDIGKLCEIDVQMEEKKEEVSDKIEEGISADPLRATSKASLEIIENKKLE